MVAFSQSWEIQKDNILKAEPDDCSLVLAIIIAVLLWLMPSVLEKFTAFMEGYQEFNIV